MEKNESTDIEKLISIRVIQEDAETIMSLLQSERSPVFLLAVMPYYALFVKACQEFFDNDYIPENVSSQIASIRNYIKSSGDRFSKIKSRIEEVDFEQNEQFKNQLKYAFLKNWNVHWNMGTYWTDDRHIIGNTQMIADYLGINNSFDRTENDRQYDLALKISSFVSSIQSGFSKVLTPPKIFRPKKGVTINWFYDLNTNTELLLFNNNYPKEINIFLLDLLCSMNFVKYILRPLLVRNNWLLRIEYITTYYTFRGLQRIRNQRFSVGKDLINIDLLADIIDLKPEVFNSRFRNCMMHYGLENREVIKDEYLELPFYGIVESCFPDTDYNSYLHKLNELSNRLIEYLESVFNSSDIKLQRL